MLDHSVIPLSCPCVESNGVVILNSLLARDLTLILPASSSLRHGPAHHALDLPVCSVSINIERRDPGKEVTEEVL